MQSFPLARSGRKLSSRSGSQFEQLAAAVAAGADWVVTSDTPSAPAAGRSLRPDLDILMVFDGGSRGNPGQGYGSFAYKGAVKRYPTSIDFPGITTNNEAEYQSMIGGLRAVIFDCETLGLPASRLKIEVRSDSQLVVHQINGKWKIKKAHLRPLCDAARELLGMFAGFDVVWHPRTESVRILGH